MTVDYTREATLIEKKCINTNCREHNVVQEFPAFKELGGVFLVNDEDGYCRECGEKLAGAGQADS